MYKIVLKLVQASACYWKMFKEAHFFARTKCSNADENGTVMLTELTQSETGFHAGSRRHISRKIRRIIRHDWTPPILAWTSDA